MEMNESEKIIKETIEFANTEIRKSKRRSKMLVIGIILGVLVLLGAYLLLFVYESPTEYREGIVEVSVPADEGIDLYVTLENYTRAKAVLVQTGGSSYDLYIGIMQTAASKLLKDADGSNNLLRVGNGLIVDYQSERLLCNMPNGQNESVIQRIYYIDHISDELAAMSDEQLMEYEAKTLIWER